VVPGYFKALGANITRGRDFDSSDGVPGRFTAIVNEQFASQYWPGENPIGKRLRKGSQTAVPWLTVVGVCSNLQVEDAEAPQSVVYTPYRQEPSLAIALIARSPLPHEGVAKILRTEVQKADPDLPLFNVMTMADYQAQIGMPLRLFTWFFSLFGILALFMSVIGIYGVTAYSVGQRTREIGIRVTLGATSGTVVWLVLKNGIGRLLVGLAFGLAGAIAISRALAGMLFHTAPTDTTTYVMVIVLYVVATLAACVIPALRTVRIDPASSLRLQ
jgi:putative ABC transport system permease protein